MNKSPTCYFLASNGYYGFKSLFKEALDAKEFDRIFIIKGGPGTGKSSLMKKIRESICSCGAECESIYCSSDISSLDGVILKNKDKKVAIIDGTAPHEADCTYPGCKDEIVNLLDGFDERRLKGYENEIVTITGNKKDYYNKAYLELLLAGKIHGYIINKVKAKFKPKEAKKLLKERIKEDNPGKENRRILISAFGCCGYKKIQTNEDSASLYLKGNGYTDEITMGLLYSRENELYKYDEVCLSPFDHNVAEVIRLGNTVISRINPKADDTVDCDSFSTFDFNEEKELIKQENDCLNTSKYYFALASKEHFKLENIYKNAMDFTGNDRHYEKICEKIKKILF